MGGVVVLTSGMTSPLTSLEPAVVTQLSSNKVKGLSVLVVPASFTDVTAVSVGNSVFSSTRHLDVCLSDLTFSSLSSASSFRIVGVLMLAGLVHSSKALSFSAGVISPHTLHIAVDPTGSSTSLPIQGVVVVYIG